MGTDATPTRPTTAPPAPASDPYFYGWRMVPRWDERRRQTWEKVPLTPWDVLHPEEEDFIVTSDAHTRDTHYLKGVFEDRLAGRADARVLCEHRVLWGPPALGAHGPDIVVFENLNGPWDPLRGTFPVAEMGARPIVVVEITSPSTRDTDLDEKVEDYYRAGVPLYIIADRRGGEAGAFVRLMAYRTTPEGFVRIPADPNGVWVEGLRIWIRTDGDLVFCADEHGTRIPDLHTQRDAEKERAEAEKTRADTEKTRADTEKTRADTEQMARLAAEQKMQQLEAELQRLRGDTN